MPIIVLNQLSQEVWKADVLLHLFHKEITGKMVFPKLESP